MSEKHGWRRILGNVEQTDPAATVVRMPRKSFEQLASALRRAMDDKDIHIAELERLDAAYRSEMDRMRELIESSSVRVRTAQEEIRSMLAELGVVARFKDEIGGGDDTRTEQDA